MNFDDVDEFAMHYGSAMLCWQRVESELFYVYWSLSRRSKYEVAAAVYDAVIGVTARLTMIDAGVAVRYEGDERAIAWKKLSSEVRKRIRDRNILAHWGLRPGGGTTTEKLHLARPGHFF